MTGVWRFNLILATLVAGLIIANLWPEDNAYHPLTDIDQASISQITLSGPQRQIELVKLIKHDSWQIASAPAQVVNAERVDELLGILRTHSYRQFPASDNNRENFGLKPPQYRISLNDMTIEFGNIDPAQQLRYVQVNNQVHLITDRYLAFLLVDETYFSANNP